MVRQENSSDKDIGGEYPSSPSRQALGFTDILDVAFSLYRNHSSLFLGPIIVHLVGTAILIEVIPTPLGFGIALPFFLIGSGGLVFASAQTYLGRDITIRAALRQTVRQFWLLLGTFLVWVLVVCGLALTLIGIPVAIYFAIRCFFFFQVVLIEETSIRNALRRSRDLVSQTWWRIFGMMLGILFFIWAIHSILEFSIGFILSLTGLLKDIDFVELIRWAIWELPDDGIELRSDVILSLIHLAVCTLSDSIMIIGMTVLYLDQCHRKE